MSDSDWEDDDDDSSSNGIGVGVSVGVSGVVDGATTSCELTVVLLEVSQRRSIVLLRGVLRHGCHELAACGLNLGDAALRRLCSREG